MRYANYTFQYWKALNFKVTRQNHVFLYSCYNFWFAAIFVMHSHYWYHYCLHYHFFSIIINIIFEIEKPESSFSQSFCSFSVVWRDSKLQLQIILKWNFLGNYELCFLLVISSLYDSIDVFSILQDPHFVISYWGFPIPKMSVLKIMVKYFWWKIFV